MPSPLGPWWSPLTWWRSLRQKWRTPTPPDAEEIRGFKFWTPVLLAIGVTELAGALSGAFRNAIPWPTISSTIGHLEDRFDWVAVIVVGVIAAVAFHAIAFHSTRNAKGRALPDHVPKPREIEVHWHFAVFRYDWLTVLVATAVTALLAQLWNDDKFVLGYGIYGGFAFFGILLPSALARWAHKEVRFPTLFLPLNALSTRFRSVPLILIAGLAILVIHLALYPWPDLARESARYAGLSASQARSKALDRMAVVNPAGTLRLTTQGKGSDASHHEAWLVYFDEPGAVQPSGCVVTVSAAAVTASPRCSG